MFNLALSCFIMVHATNSSRLSGLGEAEFTICSGLWQLTDRPDEFEFNRGENVNAVWGRPT